MRRRGWGGLLQKEYLTDEAEEEIWRIINDIVRMGERIVVGVASFTGEEELETIKTYATIGEMRGVLRVSRCSLAYSKGKEKGVAKWTTLRAR